MISGLGFNPNRYTQQRQEREKKKKKPQTQFLFEDTDLDETSLFADQPTPTIVIEAFGLSQQITREENESDYSYIKRLVTEHPETTIQNQTIHEFTSNLDSNTTEKKLNDIISILCSVTKNPRPGIQLTQLAKGFAQLLRHTFFNIELTQKVLIGINNLLNITAQVYLVLASKTPSPPQLQKISESLKFQIKLWATLFRVFPKKYPFPEKILENFILQATKLENTVLDSDIKNEINNCYNALIELLETLNKSKPELVRVVISSLKEMQPNSSLVKTLQNSIGN